MAAEAWTVISEYGDADITTDYPGAERHLCDQIARAALAAYRAECDKEA